MTKRSMKSRLLMGVVLGTSAFAVSACQDEKSETAVFDRDWDCYAQGEELPFDMAPEQCNNLLTEAKAEHVESAPRYNALEVCEEEHGEGNCQADPAAANAGGGSSFMPFFMGYMVGNMLSDNGHSTYASRPLISTKSGSYATTDGKVKVNGLNGRTQISNRSLSAKPKTTLGKPPMTRSTVRSSGGFGRTSTGGGFRGG